jgi:hypothetical protein
VKQQSANVPHQEGHEPSGKATRPVPPLPTVGAPLDGSQYQNIVEEQKYSGQRPAPKEQRPRDANPGNAK